MSSNPPSSMLRVKDTTVLGIWTLLFEEFNMKEIKKIVPGTII